jgi:hypothetical protein
MHGRTISGMRGRGTGHQARRPRATRRGGGINGNGPGAIMGELRAVSGAETDNVKRMRAWTAAGDGRVIDEDGVGWWEARERGILVKRRQDLGQLMDALERQ